LEERTGVCRPAQIAGALGVKRADNGKPLEQVKSFVLGTNPVSPLDMAEAYATFGANGVHCEPIAITQIINRAGKRLAIPQPDCHQAIDPKIAAGVTALLRGVIDGPGPRTGAKMALGRPAAGKTGTTDSRISVWFIGYTPDLAAAVWAGNPSPPAGGYPLVNRTIGGRQYGNICGGCLPGPIWKMAMTGALKGVPKSNFVSADSRTFNNSDADTVPDVRGLTRGQAINALEEAGLRWRISSSRRSSRQPAERVAFTDPGAGDTVRDGQRVTIFISTGRSTRGDDRVIPTPTPTRQSATRQSATRQSNAGATIAPTANEEPRRRDRRGNRGGGGGGGRG
jgi:membrane peptidoglycan carboxypeptidase